MDALTTAALERVTAAVKDKPSGSYTEVLCEDVTLLCGAVKESTSHTAAIAHGARPEEREPHGKTFMETDKLRHLIEQLA